MTRPAGHRPQSASARSGGALARRVRHVHFVGIGGIGMSGIAEVLLNLGFEVSGSDLRATAATERLAGLGGRVFQGHDARPRGRGGRGGDLLRGGPGQPRGGPRPRAGDPGHPAGGDARRADAPEVRRGGGRLPRQDHDHVHDRRASSTTPGWTRRW